MIGFGRAERHSRCLLPFDDRTFVGDVRSSEMCQKGTLTDIGVMLRIRCGKPPTVTRKPAAVVG